jgi:hypothetical protein
MNITDFVSTRTPHSFEEFNVKFPDVFDGAQKPDQFACAYVYEDHWWIFCFVNKDGQLVLHCQIESTTHVSKSLSKLEKVLFNWAND